ncbi:hypothetical protein D3C80_2002270 [compost metagenome]
MVKFITHTRVQTQTIQDTCMAFCIIYDYVMTGYDSINCRHHTLVAKVQQHSIFFTYMLCKFFFQLIMVIRVTTHHTGTHRVSQTVFCSGIGIRFSDFRMIC